MPGRGPLQRVSILGGTPETITPLRGASWGADGNIVYSTSEGARLRVAADGPPVWRRPCCLRQGYGGQAGLRGKAEALPHR